MSRPRTATKVLELKGSFKHDPQRKRARENEPVTDKPLGNPPRHLTKNQKVIWKEIQSKAIEDVLNYSDRLIVEMISVLLDDFRTNYSEFSASKLSRLESMLAKIGMTSADRSRISVEKKTTDENDPWANF